MTRVVKLLAVFSIAIAGFPIAASDQAAPGPDEKVLIRAARPRDHEAAVDYRPHVVPLTLKRVNGGRKRHAQ